METTKEFQRTRLNEIIETIAEGMAEHYGHGPAAWEQSIRHILVRKFGSLAEEKRCFSCDAKIGIDTFKIDYTDSFTMIEIGKKVRENIDRGIPFTQANRVKINGMQDVLNSTQINRVTQLKYLGLIAKYTENGQHKGALWVITKRGFKFLRNEPVPSQVTVYRKKIIKRTEDLTTMRIAMSSQDSTPEDRYWDTNCFERYYEDIEL